MHDTKLDKQTLRRPHSHRENRPWSRIKGDIAIKAVFTCGGGRIVKICVHYHQMLTQPNMQYKVCKDVTLCLCVQRPFSAASIFLHRTIVLSILMVS